MATQLKLLPGSYAHKCSSVAHSWGVWAANSQVFHLQQGEGYKTCLAHLEHHDDTGFAHSKTTVQMISMILNQQKCKLPFISATGNTQKTFCLKRGVWIFLIIDIHTFPPETSTLHAG